MFIRLEQLHATLKHTSKVLERTQLMSTTTDPTPYTQPQACLYLLPTYHQQVPSCERLNAHVHAHTRAHVSPYVPGHGPVPTCTRFWVACAGTQKHSLLENSPILDPFGALGSN